MYNSKRLGMSQNKLRNGKSHMALVHLSVEGSDSDNLSEWMYALFLMLFLI